MIGRVAGLPQLAGNMGRAARNLGLEMTHNHDLLRYNAFPIAVTLQSAMRLFQAHYSAYKERNTPNGPFRYRQAIDTTLREPLGIFAQYILLRMIENAVKKRIDHHLGLEHKETQGLLSRLWSGKNPNKKQGLLAQMYEAGRAWWKGTPKYHIEQKDAGYGMLVERNALKKADERKFQKNMVERLPKLQKWLPMLRGKSAEAAAKWLRTWVPLMVAAPISVLVAGYALEKFIRNYAGTIVNGITRVMTGHDPTAHQEKAPKSAENQPMAKGFVAPGVHNGATQYFRRLYLERENRARENSWHQSGNVGTSAFSRMG